MEMAIQWSKYLKQENPLVHKFFLALYPICAALLVVLSLIEGLPLVSLSHVSTISQVLLVLTVIGLTHITSAGVMHSFSEGRNDKACTIAAYGGIVLIAVIASVP